MITTTIEALLTAKPVLQQVANTPMAAKDAFKVLKTLKTIEKEFESIETVQRSLLEKYGAREEDGTFMTDPNSNFIIIKEKSKDYVTEMQAFLSEKVELNCGQIDFEIIEKVELTPAQLMLLEDFIKE